MNGKDKVKKIKVMENIDKEKLRGLLSKATKEELIERQLRDYEKGEKTLLKELKQEIDIKEELTDAIRDSFLIQFKKEEFIRELLMTKGNYYNSNDTPTDLTKEIMRKVIDDDFLNTFRDGLKKYLTEHFNEVCKQVLLDAFLKGITDRNVVGDAVREVVYEHMNKFNSSIYK